jgi:hypothetical protein
MVETNAAIGGKHKQTLPDSKQMIPERINPVITPQMVQKKPER